jgi:hypothetical protein
MKGRTMQISSRGISWLLPLAFAVAAIAVSGAQARPQPEVSAELREIHWKHEDALYGAGRGTSRAQAAAQLWARHWAHEDALYRARSSASGSKRAETPDLDAVGGGFGWSDALSGAGGAVALIVVSAAATIGIRRRHSRFARS